MDISHLYGNALCFAPKHLVVESRSANTLRAKRAGRGLNAKGIYRNLCKCGSGEWSSGHFCIGLRSMRAFEVPFALRGAKGREEGRSSQGPTRRSPRLAANCS
jgi:hypothetical protein